MQDELSRFHDGEPELIATLYEVLTPRMRCVARTYCRCEADVDDIVHETWLRILAGRRSLRRFQAVRLWSLRICRTVCRRWKTSDQKVTVNAQALTHVAQEGQKTEAEAWQAAEYIDDVITAVLRLPERQRLTVIQRVVYSQSVSSTARILGCADGTVKAALHQALVSLRRRLPEPPAEL